MEIHRLKLWLSVCLATMLTTASAQTESFLGLKLVHSINDISKSKTYVLLAEQQDGNAYVMKGEKGKGTGEIRSISLNDFYSDAENSLVKFNQIASDKLGLNIGGEKLCVKQGGNGYILQLGESGSKYTTLYPNVSNWGISFSPIKGISDKIALSENATIFKFYSSGYGTAYIYEYTPLTKVGDLKIQTTEGYATYFIDKAFVMPKGLKGAIVNAANPSSGELTIVWNYKEGDLVPANTALLLRGTYGETYTFYAPDESDAETQTAKALSAGNDNLLRGSVTEETTSAPNGESDSKYLFYKMYYMTTINGDNSENDAKKTLGFYWGAENGGTFKNAANHSYLALPNTTATNHIQGFAFESGYTTGIKQITNDVVNSKNGSKTIYNLNGKQVPDGNLQRGIYIINGNKILIR